MCRVMCSAPRVGSLPITVCLRARPCSPPVPLPLRVPVFLILWSGENRIPVRPSFSALMSQQTKSGSRLFLGSPLHTLLPPLCQLCPISLVAHSLHVTLCTHRTVPVLPPSWCTCFVCAQGQPSLLPRAPPENVAAPLGPAGLRPVHSECLAFG